MLFRSFMAVLSLLSILKSPIFSEGDATWVKVSEDDGITAYMRHEKGSSIFEGKIVGLIEAPIAAIEAILRDPNTMKEYAFNCCESYPIELPEMVKSEDIKYAYQRMRMPWPVKDRDCVAHIDFTTDPRTGAIFANGKGLDAPYPLADEIIRMPVSIAIYTLVPKGEKQTEMTMEGIVDPGGNLPEWVVSLFSKIGSIKTFKNIRAMATSDKYINAPAVMTTTIAIK